MTSYYTSILLLCWIALAVLTILVHENNRIPLEDKRILYVTYALVAGAALAEFCGVRLDGRAEPVRRDVPRSGVQPSFGCSLSCLLWMFSMFSMLPPP